MEAHAPRPGEVALDVLDAAAEGGNEVTRQRSGFQSPSTFRSKVSSIVGSWVSTTSKVRTSSACAEECSAGSRNDPTSSNGMSKVVPMSSK